MAFFFLKPWTSRVVNLSDVWLHSALLGFDISPVPADIFNLTTLNGLSSKKKEKGWAFPSRHAPEGPLNTISRLFLVAGVTFVLGLVSSGLVLKTNPVYTNGYRYLSTRERKKEIYTPLVGCFYPKRLSAYIFSIGCPCGNRTPNPDNVNAMLHQLS